jgi:hypothetical protein
MAMSSSPGTHQTAPDVPAEIVPIAPTQKLPSTLHDTDWLYLVKALNVGIYIPNLYLNK